MVVLDGDAPRALRLCDGAELEVGLRHAGVGGVGLDKELELLGRGVEVAGAKVGGGQAKAGGGGDVVGKPGLLVERGLVKGDGLVPVAVEEGVIGLLHADDWQRRG